MAGNPIRVSTARVMSHHTAGCRLLSPPVCKSLMLDAYSYPYSQLESLTQLRWPCVGSGKKALIIDKHLALLTHACRRNMLARAFGCNKAAKRSIAALFSRAYAAQPLAAETPLQQQVAMHC